MGHILRSKVLRNSIFKSITTFEVSHIDYVINYMWQSRIRGFYKFGLLLRKVGFLTLQLNKVSWPMIKSWLFHLSISLSFFWFSNSSFLNCFNNAWSSIGLFWKLMSTLNKDKTVLLIYVSPVPELLHKTFCN